MAVQGTIKKTSYIIKAFGWETVCTVILQGGPLCKAAWSCSETALLWASPLCSTLAPWPTHRIIAGFQGGFSVSKSMLLARKQPNQLCFSASTHHALRPQAACWPWSWWSATKYDPTTDWEEAQGTWMGLSTTPSPKPFLSCSAGPAPTAAVQVPAAFLCSACNTPFTSKPLLGQPFSPPAPEPWVYFQGLCNVMLSCVH